jgi:xanthine dehydrogenase YagS FAD-binding subunit
MPLPSYRPPRRCGSNKAPSGTPGWRLAALPPNRACAAEEILQGARPGADAYRRAAEAALAGAKPSGDNQFKIELARRILVRTLTLAAAETPARVAALPASPFSTLPGALIDA